MERGVLGHGAMGRDVICWNMARCSMVCWSEVSTGVNFAEQEKRCKTF